jgi:hypothetical protein
MTCRRARVVASSVTAPSSLATVFENLFATLAQEITKSHESDSTRASNLYRSSSGEGGRGGQAEAVGTSPCTQLAVSYRLQASSMIHLVLLGRVEGCVEEVGEGHSRPQEPLSCSHSHLLYSSSKFPVGLPALCTVALTGAASLPVPSPSLTTVAMRTVRGVHCGNRFGRGRSSTSVTLRARCSAD